MQKRHQRFFTFVAILCSMPTLHAMTPPVCQSKTLVASATPATIQRELESALKAHPTDLNCMLKLASLYLKSDHVSQGFRLIYNAYHIDPDFVKKHNIAKVLDLALRLTQLEDLAQKNRDYHLYNDLGESYYDMGIFKDATDAFEKSLALNPKQKDIQILLALSLGNLDRMKEAAKIIRKVLDAHPFDFYANYYYGKILKNELHKPDDGKGYLLAAQFILENYKVPFKREGEKRFLKRDILHELEEK